ncbi:MAG TPA: hypothetical protein ENN09_03445, partial [Planctomycetes bacterium]|nr:hypothetical protein [Planctomycetota bacterium]
MPESRHDGDDPPRQPGAPARSDEAVAEYLRLAASADAAPEAFNKAVARLESAFWKRVDDVVAAVLDAAEPSVSSLQFSVDDRLLLDFGLLDERLLGADAQDVRKRLIEERRSPPPAPFSVIYLSDWIENRFQYYLTIEEVDREKEVAEYIRRAPETAPLVERRSRILSVLQPFMRHLPGVGDILGRFIAEGRLDDLMLRLFIERRSTSASGSAQSRHPLDEKLLRIEAACRFVMNKVADRVPEEKHLQLIEEYNALRLELFRQVGRLPKDAFALSVSGVDMLPVAAKVRSEIRLVKSLLNLGSLSGGITRPHSVLLRDAPRATPAAVGGILELVRDADPGISLDHSVLIAPFTGNGFFEWDRDTVVVSLIPVRSVDEDVVSALAGMRIALDAFQHGETLKSAYEKVHPGRDFRETFTKDYLQWVLKVGRGQKQQMDKRSFELFLKLIGHNGVDPVVPHELAHVTVSEKDRLFKAILEKIHNDKATARDIYLAGVIRWQRGDYRAASRYLEDAASLAPHDGAVLYSLGIVLRNMRMRGPARKYLVECTRAAPQTIWQV